MMKFPTPLFVSVSLYIHCFLCPPALSQQTATRLYIDATGGVDNGDCLSVGQPCATLLYAFQRPQPSSMTTLSISLSATTGTYFASGNCDINLSDLLTMSAPNISTIMLAPTPSPNSTSLKAKIDCENAHRFLAAQGAYTIHLDSIWV